MKPCTRCAFVYLLMWVAAFVAMALINSCARGAEERVAPQEDSTAWYVSIIGTPQQTAPIVKMFESGDLKRFKTKSHFALVTPDSSIYAERYSKNQGDYAIAELPCVRVQDGDGVVVLQVCGSHVPASQEVLATEIATAVDKSTVAALFTRRNRDRQRTDTSPAPCPCPRPDQTVAPLVPPLLNLNLQPESSPAPDFDFSPLRIVTVLLTALVAGMASGFATALVQRGVRQ